MLKPKRERERDVGLFGGICGWVFVSNVGINMFIQKKNVGINMFEIQKGATDKWGLMFHPARMEFQCP
jgi:hypothetical protein